MCFCESDAVKILIHLKARKRYPGIRFHEKSLDTVAKRFSLTETGQIRTMTDEQLACLSQALLAALPGGACPEAKVERRKAG